MPWQKGKSRRRYNAAKKSWSTRRWREGIRDVVEGALSFFHEVIGKALSAKKIVEGSYKIARSFRK